MQLSVLLITTKARGQAHDSVHSSVTTISMHTTHQHFQVSDICMIKSAFIVREHLKTGVSDLKHLNVFDNMTVFRYQRECTIYVFCEHSTHVFVDVKHHLKVGEPGLPVQQ